jgi:hypothetical protein
VCRIVPPHNFTLASRAAQLLEENTSVDAIIDKIRRNQHDHQRRQTVTSRTSRNTANMSSKDLNNNRYQQGQGGVNKIKFLLWKALMSPFNPEAKGRKRWDFLLLLLWCYCAFEMPFRFAFHLELDEDFLDTLKAIDAAADVIFLMDIGAIQEPFYVA